MRITRFVSIATFCAWVVPTAIVADNFVVDATREVSRVEIDAGSDPEVAMSPSGRAVAVWDDCELWFARSEDRGVTWTEPQLLDPSVGEDDRFTFRPQIATDGQGTWIVVWHSGGYDSPDEVRFFRSVNDGVTWSGPTILAVEGDDLTSPDVASDGDDTWVVVWRGLDGIRACRSDDDGLSWDLPVKLGPGDAPLPVVASDGQGTWIAAWPWRPTPDPYLKDIRWARSTDGGVTWVDLGVLNDDGSTIQAMDISLAGDGQGNWVAAWNSHRVGSDYEIYTATSTDDGSTWGASAQLVDNGNYRDEDPHVLVDGDRGWVVTWNSFDSAPQGTTHFASVRPTILGAWMPPEVVRATEGGTWDLSPALATDGNNNWTLVWQTHYSNFERQIQSATFHRSYAPTCPGDLDRDGLASAGDPVCPLGGQPDCDDGNERIWPGAAPICDGLNNDCDHPSWPGLALTNELDDDGDGRSECDGDCDDDDAQVWAQPLAIDDLRLGKGPMGETLLQWSPPAEPGAVAEATQYDTIRSEGLFLCNDYTDVCVQTDGSLTEANDPDLPLPGLMFSYVVRAENGCFSLGLTGLSSSKDQRLARDCR